MRAVFRTRDRGQAVVLLLAVIVLAVVVAAAAAAFGVRLAHRQQAQAAADAAALAGALEGRAAAAAVAAANDADLLSFVALGDDVLVVVAVGGERASARATRAP